MKSKNRLVVALATAGLALTSLVSTSGTANAAPVVPNPIPWVLRVPSPLEDSNFVRAVATSIVFPFRDPIGANDWTCRPSAAHPEPVVLIHGTWENAYNNWNGLSPILKAQGYCVYAVNYGNSTGLPQVNATGDMVAAAYEISAFVNRVVASTGAKHVALIGHSQGGAQARYVANLIEPAGLVDKVIALGPSNHPTTLSGIVTLGNLLHLTNLGFTALEIIQMPAAVQQASPTAPFYVNLNGHGETVPGIDYTVIATMYDEFVTPYTQAFIKAGPGATVDNITIQTLCPIDLSEHVSLSYSKNAAQIVLNKLDPDHPHVLVCYPQAPIIGGTGPV